MKETTRTLVFAGVAALAVLTAVGAHTLSRPKPIEGFERVGSEFYPEFKDATAPRGLRVAAFNEDQAEIQDFEVAFKDGRWVIPSHNSYPADAKDRLAKTAASVMGITRDALASRRESDHEKLGVIDPLTEGGEHLKGRGQRITLTAADGTTVLADYVIGKKVEGAEGLFYVRSPTEKETYRAKLSVNLSTKFGDWIEADLLQVDADKLVALTIDRHSIDLARKRFVDKPETSRLTRANSSDPWKLEGLDEATEELKTEEVRTMVSSLDDLKIIGVRPKPPGLRPDLTVDPRVVRSQGELIRLQNSLFGKGFLPLEDENGNVRLGSTEGQVTATQNDGVEFVLYFGEVFTGSTKEIEIGFATEDEPAAGDKKPDDAKSGDAKPDGEENGDKPEGDAKADDEDKGKEGADSKPGDPTDKKKAELKKSRYLLVMARFDEAALGPAFTKPEPPAETDAPAAPEKQPDDPKPESKPESKPDEKANPKSDEDEEDEEEDRQPGDAAQAAADAPAEAEIPGEAKVDPKADREALMAQYRKDLETYKNDVSIRDGKIEQGKKRVEQLNKRFGEWYYVISAESFDSLRLSRKALVKEKEKPAEPKPEEKKDDDKKDDAPASPEKMDGE